MNKLSLIMCLIIDFIWLRSSFGKLIDQNKFINSLGTILAKFESNNPYPLYKDFLNLLAIPNSRFLASLIIFGESFTALSLLTGAFYFLFKKEKNKALKILIITGLSAGALLNLSFWLASAWTSPSTDSLNLLMFLMQTLLIINFLKPQLFTNK